MDLTPMWFGVYKASKYLLYPLSWIVLSGLLTLLIASLPVTPRRTTWVRRLAFSTVLLLFLTATPLLSHLYISQLEARYPPFAAPPVAKFDAVVVLAGGVFHKGSLRPADETSDPSRQRTACGAELWFQGLAPKMVLAGGEGRMPSSCSFFQMSASISLFRIYSPCCDSRDKRHCRFCWTGQRPGVPHAAD